jgi:hypothetical protein
MKKSIVIFLFFITLGAKAQGNLQFNQVLTYNGSINTGTNSPIWKVPLNKVWKIEAKSLTGGPDDLIFYVNSTPYYDVFRYSIPGGVTYYSAINTGVIWLKANDEIKFLKTYGNGTSDYFISIIEFNITQ